MMTNTFEDMINPLTNKSAKKLGKVCKMLTFIVGLTYLDVLKVALDYTSNIN